jgi:hypothetical protein
MGYVFTPSVVCLTILVPIVMGMAYLIFCLYKDNDALRGLNMALQKEVGELRGRVDAITNLNSAPISLNERIVALEVEAETRKNQPSTEHKEADPASTWQKQRQRAEYRGVNV